MFPSQGRKHKGRGTVVWLHFDFVGSDVIRDPFDPPFDFTALSLDDQMGITSELTETEATFVRLLASGLTSVEAGKAMGFQVRKETKKKGGKEYVYDRCSVADHLKKTILDKFGGAG
ncbi:MAG: hypothetical protein CMJ75_18870 [Planctomycetaceae bacterium]|nr:hypothetical protein [Planctomycetaceae bacterium]